MKRLLATLAGAVATVVAVAGFTTLVTYEAPCDIEIGHGDEWVCLSEVV